MAVGAEGGEGLGRQMECRSIDYVEAVIRVHEAGIGGEPKG